MSSSDSIHALAMMESVALNEESRVIVDDLDYVLVSKNNDNDAMEVDDDSYDYCEDVVSMLSVEQPSSLSVCSDLPSIDPACFGIEKEEAKPQRRPRVISFGNDEDELCTRTGKFESTVEPLDEQMTETEESVESVDTPIVEPEPPVEENQTMSEADERIESIAETAMTEMKSCRLPRLFLRRVKRGTIKKPRRRIAPRNQRAWQLSVQRKLWKSIDGKLQTRRRGLPSLLLLFRMFIVLVVSKNVFAVFM